MNFRHCIKTIFISVAVGAVFTFMIGCSDDDNPSDSSGLGGPNDYATDVGPCSVVGVDLDNDVDLDLAVANAYSDNFSLLKNDGYGNFTLIGNYPAGDCPTSICGTDCNGDGIADIITANALSYEMSIWFGRPEFVPVPWTEQFTHSTLDAAKWAYNAGGEVTDSALNAPSLKYAMKFEGGGDTLISQGIDLTGKEATVVSYYYQEGGAFDPPDAEDYLWVDFLNDLDQWVTVDTVRGRGLVSNAFLRVIIPLPGWAIRDDFQLRFRTSEATYGRDVWFIDNITVGQYIYPDGHFDAGAAPKSICGADFNGDDSLDYVVANYFFGNISLFDNKGLMKTGSWTFDKTDYNAGDNPMALHVADLDNDDDFDVAVANAGSDDVSVLLNDGNGAFAAPVNYACGDSPYSVFCAPLDDDDYYDLAVVNRRSDDMSVFINNGDGTFDDGVIYECANGPCFVYGADIDGQNGADLIVCNRDSKNLTIFYNNGSGNFGSKTDYATAYSPYSVHCVILDDDNYPDLVVTYRDSYMISIFFNQGGNLSAAVNFDMSQ